MRKIVGSEEMGVLLLLIKGLDLMHVSERKTEKIISLCHDLNTMVPLMNYMADNPDSKPRELMIIAEELNMKNECGMLPEISKDNISGEVAGIGYEFLNKIFDNIHEKR